MQQRTSRWIVLGLLLGSGVLLAPLCLCAGCNEWTTNGPWGGAIAAVTVAPTAPETVYVAGRWGRIYRSVDGGLSWVERSQGLPQAEMNLITWLAADPLFPTTLYAGGNKGVYRSDDAGDRWIPIMGGLPEYPDIRALALSPRHSGHLFAYSGNWVAKGFYMSSDGGASWYQASDWHPRWDCNSLAYAPSDPSVLYAGCGGVYLSTDGGSTWVERGDESVLWWAHGLAVHPCDPEGVYCLNNIGTVFRSQDGGAHWESLAANQPEHLEIRRIAIESADPTTVYFGTWSGGVYKSPDSGDSWFEVNDGLRGRYITSMALSPGVSGTVFVGTEAGAFSSQDAGSSWLPRNGGLPGLTINSVAIGREEQRFLYAGTRVGLFTSSDGGVTWVGPSDQFPLGSVDSVGVAPHSPGTVFVSYENWNIGGASGLYLSEDSGRSWKAVSSGTVAIRLVFDPGESSIAYALENRGPYKTVDGGFTWEFRGAGASEDALYQALAMDSGLPSNLYLGGYYYPGWPALFKTVDGGSKWFESSAGIAPEDSIHSLAVAPHDSSQVYAGSFGGIYRSHDGGLSWEKVTRGLPDSSYYSALAVGEGAPFTLLAGNSASGVYKSTDGASTWVKVSGGLPPWCGKVQEIALDPSDHRKIFAACEYGLYSIELHSLPGDCDGDYQVSIGEVQRAVNMFMGLELPACGVDAGGDGVVTIGEVQRVINAFLGIVEGCA